MKRDISWILVIVFLIMSVMTVARAPTVSSESDSPRIYVDPLVSTAAPGQNFTVNVVIADVTADDSVYVWEVDISFNSTILNVTSVGQGPFLKNVGNPFWQSVIKNWKGTVVASETFLPPLPPTGAVGSGVLANITFQVLSEGETSMHFYYTGLRVYRGDTVWDEISHTTVDGFFAYPLLRDIAITGVTAYPTSVPAGKPVSINVTVENEGEIAETFDVTVLYDSTDIETKTVTNLAVGGSETLSFSWDTTDLAEGNYTITAVTSEVSGETDTADNTFTNVVVTVTASSWALPVPLFVIVAIVVVVAALCVAVLLYTRRRRLTKHGVVTSFLLHSCEPEFVEGFWKRMKVEFDKSCSSKQ